MEHTTIFEGWLVKSPPERKASGPFKLFKAKWRRRWFVLHEKPASEALPGTRAALDYFSNSKLQKKLGFIDLEHCEEVLCKLDTELYKHVFSVRTKHKNRDRCYYLASDTEVDMMKWVDCLCLALGLKENDDNPVVPRPAVEPTFSSPPLSSSPVNAVNVLQDGQVSPLLPSKSLREVNALQESQRSGDSLHSQHESRAIETTSAATPAVTTPDRSEGYIPLEDCFSGKPTSQSNDSLRKDGQHRVSQDSIPPEPPPAPPMKLGKKEVFSPMDPSLYDMPKKSYINLDDNENVYKIPAKTGMGGEISPAVYKVFRSESQEEENVYKMPRSYNAEEEGVYKYPTDFGNPRVPVQQMYETENIYKVPPPSVPVSLSEAAGRESLPPEGWYDLPPTAAPPRPVRESMSRGSHVDGQYYNRVVSPGYSPRSSEQLDLYDTPRRLSQGNILDGDSRNVNTLGRVSTAQDLYDAPKSCRKTLSENNLLESVVPAPPRPSGDNGQMLTAEGRYKNLPNEDDPQDPWGRHRVGSHPRPPSSHVNSHLMESTYDVPPPSKHVIKMNDSEKLSQMPPPPKPCQTHSYINTPTDTTIPKEHPPVNPASQTSGSYYMPIASSDNVENMRASLLAGSGHIGGDLYSDMKGISLQPQDLYSIPSSNRPVNPSVHDVVPPPSKTKAFIEPKGNLEKEAYILPTATHRTRSFKRPLQQNVDDVALPTRRTMTKQEEPASSDDESSSSGTHDKSGDSLNYRIQPMMYQPHLPPKLASLNSTPPPPKNPGEVQYLDLALDASSDNDKSPLSSRGPALGNVSPTDYKEIDFVKTKALNEMQKDVESKRKSSERSVDE